MTRPWDKYCSDKCGMKYRNLKRAERVKAALEIVEGTHHGT